MGGHPISKDTLVCLVTTKPLDSAKFLEGPGRCWHWPKFDEQKMWIEGTTKTLLKQLLHDFWLRTIFPEMLVNKFKQVHQVHTRFDSQECWNLRWYSQKKHVNNMLGCFKMKTDNYPNLAIVKNMTEVSLPVINRGWKCPPHSSMFFQARSLHFRVIFQQPLMTRS